VQPEVLYTSKGTKEIFASSVAAYQSLGYLNVPVLLKFKIPHFFVKAGPQLGGLHAKQTVERATTEEIDNKPTYRSTDLGYALGLGVLGTNGLLLGVRYTGGLTKVPNADPQPRIRNNTFHIYMGYVFNSSK
jgi:hypothetical protein